MGLVLSMERFKMTDAWLTGWKEIATYIGCSIRTAKRYHYDHNMPVHRKLGKPRATKIQLDEWLQRVDQNCTFVARSWHVHGTKMTP